MSGSRNQKESWTVVDYQYITFCFIIFKRAEKMVTEWLVFNLTLLIFLLILTKGVGKGIKHKSFIGELL